MINDRLSFMRFLGLGLGDRVPDAKTIWKFRERLTRAGAVDRRFRLIRCWDVTDASLYDGRLLRKGLLDPTNTGAGVWADTAYRLERNETWLQRHGFISHIHRRLRSPPQVLPHRLAAQAGAPRDGADRQALSLQIMNHHDHPQCDHLTRASRSSIQVESVTGHGPGGMPPGPCAGRQTGDFYIGACMDAPAIARALPGSV